MALEAGNFGNNGYLSRHLKRVTSGLPKITCDFHHFDDFLPLMLSILRSQCFRTFSRWNPCSIHLFCRGHWSKMASSEKKDKEVILPKRVKYKEKMRGVLPVAGGIDLHVVGTGAKGTPKVLICSTTNAR